MSDEWTRYLRGFDRLPEFLRREAFPDAREVRVVAAERPGGGGSWETFIVGLEVDRASAAAPTRVVIRRAPAGGPLAPYDVRKDVLILTSLAKTDVPVLSLLAHTADPSIFERPFSVTEYVEGESHDLSKVERWPVWQRSRRELGHQMVDVLAALQEFRWQDTDLPSVLGVRGPASVRIAEVVDRYLQPLLDVGARKGIPQTVWRDMGLWIKENVPELPEEELVVVHGDYRFGNFIWQGTSMAAVLDWERAMLGDPMQELAFICMPLSRRVDPGVMGKALSYEELAERYEQRTGRSVDLRKIQFYAVLWQFIEGVNGSRGIIEFEAKVGRVGSAPMLSPNLVIRQTLDLMEAFDTGRRTL